MRFFEKDLSDIDWTDFTNLTGKMSLGLVPKEGSYLELKKELDEFNKWQSPTNGKRNISKVAKGKITKEICAFANSDGGTLILGLDEVSLAPTMIADVEELSNRLDQLCRNIIEPPLMQVEIRELTNGGTDGVIIIEVTASKKAPHRLNASDIPSEMKGQVYIRSNKSSIPVTMSQVHDLVRSRDLKATRFTDRINNFKIEKLKLSVIAGKRFIFGINGFPHREFRACIPEYPFVVPGSSAENFIGIAAGIPFSLVDADNSLTQKKRVLRGERWRYIDRINDHTVYITFKESGEFCLELRGGNREPARSKLRLGNIIGVACWTANIVNKFSLNTDYEIVPYVSGKFAEIVDYSPVGSTLDLTTLFGGTEVLPELSFRYGDDRLNFINQLLSDFFDLLGVSHPEEILNEYQEHEQFWDD